MTASIWCGFGSMRAAAARPRSAAVVGAAEADEVLGEDPEVEGVEGRATSSRRQVRYSLNAYANTSRALTTGSCDSTPGLGSNSAIRPGS